jgi:mRNA-degrading endonuclease RelE of RelBE toxin-antitoxin system
MTLYLTRWARRDLERFPRDARGRIIEALRVLRDRGEGDILPLDEYMWRLRVGDYRIFYGQEGPDIWVLKVMHRRKGYSPELIDTLIKRLEMLKTTER